MMVSPVSAGLCDGLEATVDGLEAAADGDEPPQAATNTIDATAVAIKSFACSIRIPGRVTAGTSYSGVT